MDRTALVAHARDTIARGSQSFALASKLFDRETRERAWLLYAWCRRCDDLADGQALGHGMSAPTDPQARLATIRERTERALAGGATLDPAFDGLAIVAGECAIPRVMIEDHIAGFALDADGWAPETEDDLLRYCHHVAGVVGQMMALVMGVAIDDEKVLARADDLGLAFQLANIARDVGEDAANGRCYLPRAWLADAGLSPETMMEAENRPKLVPLVARLCDRAEAFEASARAGTAALPFRSAWAVLAAAGIYGDIARKVRARGEAALISRTITTGGEKARWLVRSFAQALRRNRAPAQAGA
ncbi:MAG: phytoene/squalene synthase family protein [Parasphingopyxis sp.]|nr:phytoene/squalene synthase family protein [Sphingomonadales bacterium]